MVAAHIFIYGSVQGVFFRRSAKMEAEKLGLVGFVRNRKDGGVDAVVEGVKSKVNMFIKWCKRGSALSKVEKVEVEWKNHLENFNEFEIL